MTNATLVEIVGGGTPGTPAGTVQSVQGVTDGTPVPTMGWAFDVTVTPTVTNGAYSGGDIMGGLMTFSNVAQAADKVFVLQRIQVSIKAAVTPSLQLVIFSADPSSTTTTDNSAYSLNAADTFKVETSLPVNALGGYLVDQGTPNTYELTNLALPIKPISGTRNIYALLIDLTGVTLTSTSDVQVRLAGL